MKLPELFLLLTLLAAPSVACAKITKLAAATRHHVEAPAQVEMRRTVREVPAEVIRACAAATRGGEFELADPGRQYQATDVIDSLNLPIRRLRWAARIPGYYAIHYERGGIGHSFHVLLVQVSERADAAPARVVWSAVSEGILKDYDRFVAALRAGQLDDNPAYIH